MFYSLSSISFYIKELQPLRTYHGGRVFPPFKTHLNMDNISSCYFTQMLVSFFLNKIVKGERALTKYKC